MCKILFFFPHKMVTWGWQQRLAANPTSPVIQATNTLTFGEGSSPFPLKWRGAGYCKNRGKMVKKQLKRIQNNYFTPVFAMTGSSPFPLKQRGSRSLTFRVSLMFIFLFLIFVIKRNTRKLNIMIYLTTIRYL